MPAVTRLGDNCTGHGCWPPRPNVSASPNVYVNGIPVHRQGDAWAVHCCGPSCHAGQEQWHGVFEYGSKNLKVIGTLEK